MNFSGKSWKLGAVVVCVLIMGAFTMPHFLKDKIPFTAIREYLSQRKPNFGLDLVGGRQIDYVVDLSKINELNANNDPDDDRDSTTVIGSIVEVLRGRIDPEGTRELNIYPATFGEEHHVIVEITDDLDNEETLQKLEKVIDLEFKEQKAPDATSDDTAAIKAQADALLVKLTAENFMTEGQAASGKDNAKFESEKKYWRDDFERSFGKPATTEVWQSAPGTLLPKVLESTSNSLVQGADGNFQVAQQKEYVLMKVVAKETAERTKTTPGEDFAKVQAEVSEQPKVTKQKLLEVPEGFQDALLQVKEGELSDILETEDSFGLFKVLAPEGDEIETSVSGIYVAKATPKAREKLEAAKKRLEPTNSTTQEEQLTVQEITFAKEDSGWQETGLGGLQFKRARVGQDPNTGRPLVEILFNDEGAKLFEQLTAKNVGKPMAIFVGGELISAPTINEKISGGAAVITMGIANYAEARKEATRLAQDLNGGSTPAPFKESGQFKIGATLGLNALSKSLKAGMIGLAILAVWMIFNYRFLGFLADLALGFYALLIFFVLQANLSFGLASILGIIVFITTLRSFSSLEKNDLMSLFMALILGILVTFIAHSPIVLTLAGVAGIVLSMGMAVDANILIFERVKEEIRQGKNFSAATALGFERAWSSIRDSNLSSLITCMILWIFGSAVIKGFAVALAMGIVVSMLTAVTITRTLMHTIITPRLAKKHGFLIAEARE